MLEDLTSISGAVSEKVCELLKVEREESERRMRVAEALMSKMSCDPMISTESPSPGMCPHVQQEGVEYKDKVVQFLLQDSADTAASRLNRIIQLLM